MKLAELTVTGFADIVSSDAPAPGGGSCAALYGAIGAALTAMVGGLTQGRKKYAESTPSTPPRSRPRATSSRPVCST